MKRIVVMGATSGIGLHVAGLLASEGALVGVAGRNAGALRGLERKFPGRVVGAVIDVTAVDAPERLRELVGRLGGMDVYLHVAGVGFGNDGLLPERELATMDTNVTGFTRMVGAAYRYFCDECAGEGHIAAVTSVAGCNGIGHLAAYSASKRFQQTYLRGLDQLSRSRKLHVCFTDIRPGWVLTPLLAGERGYPMLMQPDYVASRIVRALRRRCRVAVIDWRWNLLVGLWRLVPNAIWVRLPVKVGAVESKMAGGGSREAGGD